MSCQNCNNNPSKDAEYIEKTKGYAREWAKYHPDVTEIVIIRLKNGSYSHKPAGEEGERPVVDRILILP